MLPLPGIYRHSETPTSEFPMLELSKIKGIVFDFDGVILESTAIKTEAFLELFADVPEHRDAILQHHIENLGISRFEKFAWIYQHLLRCPLSAEQSHELGERYAGIVRQRILVCPFVPGALALLRDIRGHWPAWVASGTPEEELHWVVRERDLKDAFVDVWGSPAHKEDILLRLLEELRLSPDQLLMVGDGLTDHQAAEKVGCQFVARDTPPLAVEWRRLKVQRVADMQGLSSLLGLEQQTAKGSEQ
jgi:beta-phosphoglucomutase-like phosphatase (HAD superfamily)